MRKTKPHPIPRSDQAPTAAPERWEVMNQCLRFRLLKQQQLKLPFTLQSMNLNIFCHFLSNFINGNRNVKFAYISYWAVMLTRLLSSLILLENEANYILLPIWGIVSVWIVMWLNYYFDYADEFVHSHLAPDSFPSETSEICTDAAVWEASH